MGNPRPLPVTASPWIGAMVTGHCMTWQLTRTSINWAFSRVMVTLNLGQVDQNIFPSPY